MASTRAAPTFYVLHGEDEFSRRAAVQTLREQMGDPSLSELNTTILDGKAVTAADVLGAVRAMPFLSDKRLVIVEGLLTWLARKGAGKAASDELRSLAEALGSLPDWARLVFVEPGTLPETNPVLRRAKELPTGYHKLFEPPQNLYQWIIQRARSAYNVAIEAQAAAALAGLVERDLRRADSELAKLAMYVNAERPITEADVSVLTPYAVEAKVFDMVDALGQRDGAMASWLLHRLLQEDDPLQLFGMMVRQFRLLILAREFLNSGGPPDQVGTALGVHPYVGKKIAGQCRVFTQEQLEQLYHFLLETDLGIKTGRVEPVLALDLLIAGVCS